MKARTRRRRLFGWGAGLLLLVAAGAQALTWQRTMVDRGSATYVSLALDQQGHPHLSRFDWGIQALKYSRFDGQVWHTDVVDGGIPNSAGSSSALALDSQDRPHISYDSLQGLRYARWDGSAWQIETVDPQRGGYTSLALDAQDRPHISYCDCPHETLKYARFDGTAWHIETVEGSNVGGYTSVKLDAQGHPHISYSGFQRLRYAHFDGTAWQLATVEELASGVVFETSFVLDGAGRPHIAYVSAPGGMKYARWDGSAWRIEGIPAGGGDVSLALDQTGQPLISFYFVDAIHQVFAVQLARFDGTAWHIETVDTEVNGKTALALDAQGRVHIGYSSFTPDALTYARGTLPPPPALTLTLTGCTTCRPGERLTVQARVTNPGPTPTPVEAKIGVRLPDDTPVNLLGPHLEVTLPPGLDTTVTLLDVVVPAGLPIGPWTCEGALLEPALGATLSRSVQPFAVLP